MSITLSEIKDPKLRQRLLAALEGATPVRPPPAQTDATAPCQTPKQPLLSTDEAKLNKTERAFLAWLRGRLSGFVSIQAITLKLADDCRYTPDFFSTEQGMPTFWEVKGFWRDDARVKIKVAARMFPWARFTAVQRVKGEWKFEEIKP